MTYIIYSIYTYICLKYANFLKLMQAILSVKIIFSTNDGFRTARLAPFCALQHDQEFVFWQRMNYLLVS